MWDVAAAVWGIGKWEPCGKGAARDLGDYYLGIAYCWVPFCLE